MFGESLKHLLKIRQSKGAMRVYFVGKTTRPVAIFPKTTK